MALRPRLKSNCAGRLDHALLLASAGAAVSTSTAVAPAMASAASFILIFIVPPTWDDVGSCFDGRRRYPARTGSGRGLTAADER